MDEDSVELALRQPGDGQYVNSAYAELTAERVEKRATRAKEEAQGGADGAKLTAARGLSWLRPAEVVGAADRI